MRRVLAGVLLTLSTAWGAHAETAQADQRILFTPTPLGGESAVLEHKPSPPPRRTAIPAPKPRPVGAARLAPRKTTRNPSVNLSKTLDLADHPVRATSLATPQPQAVDFSRGVDLGGVSLGLAAGRDEGTGSGGTGLVPLDTKTPIPSDPALATRQNIPFLGLSLSTPTN